MLHRLNAIEEIGRFSKLTHRAEQFSKLSLIFARNGFGKSTLCSILRSAADGNANHIKSRRRLGAVNDSRVESIWASGATIAYSFGKWNGCPGKIHIFDQDFVLKNLHVGESVTRDNKRSLLPVVLGDHGVKLAAKVIELDKEQREVDEQRRQQSRLIITQCQGITDQTVSSFCQADFPPDLSEKIKLAAQRVELSKQSTVVKQKTNPPLLPIGNLIDATALLAETIENVNENAAQLVRNHLDAHKLGERAQGWLEYGTIHATEGHCPYCAQNTNGVLIVSAYQAYFSAAFKDLKQRIDNLNDTLQLLSTDKIEELVTANNADFSYWANLCDISPAPTLQCDDIGLIGTAFSKLKNLVAEKIQNPLAPISFGDDQELIEKAIARLLAYNENVSFKASVIDQARSETSGGNLQQAELNHAKWLSLAKKAQEPVKSAVAAYQAAEARLAAIKVEKPTVQNALTVYTATTMAARQHAVNECLSDFGANFRIVDAKTSFAGREPNTEFAIEIGIHKVKAGDKSPVEPCFSTLLSAGDKSTLAFALFVAQVRADSDLGSSIIVLDDPFSSQDIHRQFQTTSYIRAICDEACQTIVLSHDPRFLQLIERNADSSFTRTFQLQCDEQGEAFLQVWSSTQELKSLYIQQAEIIREYATHQKLLKGRSLNCVMQAIRPFLEDHLRLRFPGRFPEQAYIFEMASAIRDAGPNDPLASAVSDLFALNEYTRPNMHGGGNVPIENELRTYCRKVTAIIGHF